MNVVNGSQHNLCVAILFQSMQGVRGVDARGGKRTWCVAAMTDGHED